MKKENKIAAIVLSVFCLVILPFINFIINSAIEDNADYYRYKDNVVTIQAVVSRVVEVSSGEDDSYKTYLTYEYNGRVYDSILWGNFSTEREVGSRVSVQIPPSNPSHIFKNDNGGDAIKIGSYFYGILVLLLLNTYGLIRNTDESTLIDADFVFKHTKPHTYAFVAFAAVFFIRILLLRFHPLYVTVDSSMLSTVIVTAISLVLAAYILLRAISYTFEDYKLVQDVCCKRSVDNSGEDTSYETKFSRGTLKTKSAYENVREGGSCWLLTKANGKLLDAFDTMRWRNAYYQTDARPYRKKICMDFVLALITALVAALIFIAVFQLKISRF